MTAVKFMWPAFALSNSGIGIEAGSCEGAYLNIFVDAQVYFLQSSYDLDEQNREKILATANDYTINRGIGLL